MPMIGAQGEQNLFMRLGAPRACGTVAKLVFDSKYRFRDMDLDLDVDLDVDLDDHIWRKCLRM